MKYSLVRSENNQKCLMYVFRPGDTVSIVLYQNLHKNSGIHYGI